MLDDAVSEIARQASGWNVPLVRGVADGIEQYLGKLLHWNQRINLTGARDMKTLLSDHLPDSFALSRLCPPSSKVVDVGAGGGLPGLPFALMRRDCEVTLVEPRVKRVAFLNTAVRETGLSGVAVRRARLEEMEDASFSLAVSRATFAPAVWLGGARAILAQGGRAVVLASGKVEEGEGAVLMEEVAYETGLGVPRWAGSYCFT